MTAHKPPARTIQLTLLNGTPTGIITAELGNWTGKAIVAPRADLPKLLDRLERKEASRTGVYFLIGEDPDDWSRTRVYVGQSEQIGNRLKRHENDEDKDFFNRICCVVDKGNGLNSAHVKYLEARIIQAVGNAGRVSLANKPMNPNFEGLNEGEKGDMDRFFMELEVLLPTLNLDVLRKAKKGKAGIAKFFFGLGKAEAFAEEVDGEFVVLEGARADDNKGNISASIRDRRDRLVQDGALRIANGGKGYVFARDHAFQSPSGAACVVYGGHVNGRDAWKLVVNGKPTKTTYKEWHADMLAKSKA